MLQYQSSNIFNFFSCKQAFRILSALLILMHTGVAHAQSNDNLPTSEAKEVEKELTKAPQNSSRMLQRNRSENLTPKPPRNEVIPPEFREALEHCKARHEGSLKTCLDEALKRRSFASVTGSTPPEFFSKLWGVTGSVQNVCANGSFESGFSGWTGFRMWHWPGGLPFESGMTPTDEPLQTWPWLSVKPFTSTACEGNGWREHCLAIETGGVDPSLQTVTPTATLNRTYSGKSLRLGGTRLTPPNNTGPDEANGYAAEGVSRRFTVTPENALYSFRYAMVHDRSHADGREAFFQTIAIDSQGNIIDSYNDSGDQSRPYLKYAGFYREELYKDWNCKTLDLSDKIGEKVLIYFLNADCAANGHSGHAYIDDTCANCENDPEGWIDITARPKACLGSSETVNLSGRFGRPPNAQNVSIKLEIYQNGNLVRTLTNPSVSGSNYNFSLSHSSFPATECYDIRTTISFDVENLLGDLVRVEKVSNSKNGIALEQTTDICLNCGSGSQGPILISSSKPDPCCHPLTRENILPLFDKEHESSNISNYRFKFRQGSIEFTTLSTQMQNYVNYLNSVDPSITQITINFRIHDKGPINVSPPPGNGPQLPSMPQQFIGWTAGVTSGPSTGVPNFWNNYGLQPGRNYMIHTGTFLNDGKKYFSDECAVKQKLLYEDLTATHNDNGQQFFTQ